MESFSANEHPLEAPRTDTRPGLSSPAAQGSPSAFQQPENSPGPGGTHSADNSSGNSSVNSSTASLSSKALMELEKEINEQTEWSGALIRRFREARGISLEEVVQVTKITKAYILAIEEENYAKLPAAVFIRGFVSQLARVLKLPQQQHVTGSYMTRLQRGSPEKFR
jgi:hypothetical protein